MADSKIKDKSLKSVLTGTEEFPINNSDQDNKVTMNGIGTRANNQAFEGTNLTYPDVPADTATLLLKTLAGIQNINYSYLLELIRAAKLWVAGEYKFRTVVTVGDSLYLLSENVTLPYVSSDFDAELLAGDWVIVGGTELPVPITDDIGKKLTVGDDLKYKLTPSTTASGFYSVNDLQEILFDVLTNELLIQGTYKIVTVSEDEYEKTDDTFIFTPPLTNSVVFIYYDNDGNLQQFDAPNREQQYDLMLTYLPVCYILWSPFLNSPVFVGDYRKGRSSNGLWVKNFYDLSVNRLSGIDVFGLTGGGGDDDADARFGLSEGEIIFTDRIYNSPTRAILDTWNIGFYSGTEAIGVGGNPFPVLTDIDLGIGVTGRLVYNNDGIPTVVVNNDFVWYFVCISNDITPADRTFIFMGNNEYGTENQARNNLEFEISVIQSNLPVKQGFSLLYAVMYQTQNTNTNAVKAHIIEVQEVVKEDGGSGAITPIPDDLINGSDASSLHNHDSLYVSKINAFFRNITDTFSGFFNWENLTADRTITWQDKSGTVALLSDITGGTVDNALSTTSENAVQNKIITNAIRSELGTFSEEIVFDKEETVEHIQVSDINLTLASSGNIKGVEKLYKITGDGISDLTIDRDNILVSGDLDKADVNHIFLYYSQLEDAYAIIKQFNKEVVGNTAPVASGVSILYDTLGVGTIADLAYLYNNVDGDLEDQTAIGTSYSLKRYNSLLEAQNDTNSTVIKDGATFGNDQEYTFVEADGGKYFVLEVTPKALTGTRVGSVYKSDIEGPVEGEFNIPDLGTTKLMRYYTDPDIAENVILDNNAPVSVQEWVDKSGNDINSIQLTKAAQPTINIDAMQFDGVDDLLIGNFVNTANLVCFIVVNIDTLDNNGRLLDFGNLSQSVLVQQSRMYSYDNATGINHPSQEIGVKKLYQAEFNGASSSLKDEGVLSNTGTMGAISVTNFGIGARYTDTSSPTEGKFYDIVILNRDECTQEDIDNVRNSLLIKHFQ